MKKLKEIAKEKNMTNISVITQIDKIISKNNTINNQSLAKNDGVIIDTQKFIFLKNYFNVSIIVLLFLFFVCILIYCNNRNEYQKENINYNKDHKLKLTENLNNDKFRVTFERLSNNENSG